MYLDIYNNITWTDRSKNWMKGTSTGRGSRESLCVYIYIAYHMNSTDRNNRVSAREVTC